PLTHLAAPGLTTQRPRSSRLRPRPGRDLPLAGTLREPYRIAQAHRSQRPGSPRPRRSSGQDAPLPDPLPEPYRIARGHGRLAPGTTRRWSFSVCFLSIVVKVAEVLASPNCLPMQPRAEASRILRSTRSHWLGPPLSHAEASLES